MGGRGYEVGMLDTDEPLGDAPGREEDGGVFVYQSGEILLRKVLGSRLLGVLEWKISIKAIGLAQCRPHEVAKFYPIVNSENRAGVPPKTDCPFPVFHQCLSLVDCTLHSQ